MNLSLAPGATVAHEQPQLIGDLFALATGHKADRFLVTSGDRGKGAQPSAANPFPVAAEGRSNHQRYAYGLGYDEAVDVVVNGVPVAQELTAMDLARYGLWAPVAGDPVHLTRLGVRG